LRPPGRARSRRAGGSLWSRHPSSRLAQAARLFALRRARDRLRADRGEAVRAGSPITLGPAAAASVRIIARIADMSGRGPLSSLVDFAWRTAFRLGFPVARTWWRLTRPRHQGVVVAVHVGPDLLLVRCSYRAGWHLPGGGVRRGEMPEEAARRELAEEIGLTTSALRPAGSTCGIWDGRVTGYISLSYAWSNCQSCGLITERSPRPG